MGENAFYVYDSLPFSDRNLSTLTVFCVRGISEGVINGYSSPNSSRLSQEEFYL